MPRRAEVEATLTGPGGMFEVVAETVEGVPMKVYKNRMRSLREVAAMGLARTDDEEYVVYGQRRYGFASFGSLANSVSRVLSAGLGIEHGDRVAVLAANNPEWCLTFWGTVDIGAVLVGLNGWWKTDEILFGLADSGTRVLVADRGRFERIAGSLRELGDLEAVYLVGADPVEFAHATGGDKRVHRFEELLTDPGPDLPTTDIDEGDPAVIFYTSGTTGRPKGAISTHRSMIANLQNTVFNAVAGALVSGNMAALGGSESASNGTKRQTASLATAPMFHVSGCHSGIVVAMLAGIRLVIPEGRFEPTKAMELIQDERISVWAAVPTMVWRVVEHPDRHRYDLSSVTQVGYGGSPSAGELRRLVLETFPNVKVVSNAYGLTESSSVATVNSGQGFLDKPDSVGRALPVVELRIADDTGAARAPGEIGEVWIRGPIITPGYWGNPEATAGTLTDGWLHTGDVGYIDENGMLFITDRVKDMIIRGGENIYCVEIENRLVEHPEILDAAVIGVPHPTLGEEVKAFVQVGPASSLDAHAVRSWVAKTLADFKVPTYVEITTDQLPRNTSGKLLKNILRGQGDVSIAETF